MSARPARPDAVCLPDDLVVRRLRTIDGEELLVASFPLPAGSTPTLTPTEREIATALLSGRTYAAIADERRVSRHTVGKQVSSLLRKLGVGSRSELVARARLLLPSPPDA